MRRLFVLLLLPICLLAKIATPSAITLTWTDDPATSMAIFWHSEVSYLPTYLHYCKIGETQWQTRLATSKTPSNILTVHTVQLEGLSPNSYYHFRIDDDPTLYSFRTLCKERPLRFIVGGDMYQSYMLLKQVTTAAAKKNPDFVVLGGDIAYTLRDPIFFKRMGWEERRWHTFFNLWSKTMVDSQGCLIPVLIATGNHDVKGPPTPKERKKSLFYDFYPLKDPLKTYRVYDINPALSLFLLDTDHGQPIEGAQTEWLEKALKAREFIPNKFAIYHKSAYPTAYPYEGVTAKKLRKLWCPLFDHYHVNVAFEHHNHTYKRTYPLKNEEIDKTGTVYLGDGAWGVPARVPKSPEDLWYLANSQALNHFFLVELNETELSIHSYDQYGQLIEEVPLPLTNSPSVN